MAYKELVIKIPEKQYNAIKSDLYSTFSAEMKIWGLEAIRNGTPYPKGHGKMVEGTRDPYKVDQIDAILNSPDIYAYLSSDKTSGAKTINLDKDVLEIVKAFYEGKKIIVKEVSA